MDEKWSVSNIQIESTEAPFTDPLVGVPAFRVVQAADAMGLYTPATALRVLNLPSFREVVRSVQKAGIGGVARLIIGTDAGPREVRQAAETLRDALEQSPFPETEWKSVTAVLGADKVASLVGVSPSSLGRYQAGERTTPLDVAERLHFLALVVGDLAGAYNELGIRRWFDRRRTALDGKSPSELLRGRWDPDVPGARRVRGLAQSLTASPAT